MASFKAKFPVLQELFAKNHRGPLPPPPAAGRGLTPPPRLLPCLPRLCDTSNHHYFCSADSGDPASVRRKEAGPSDTGCTGDDDCSNRAAEPAGAQLRHPGGRHSVPISGTGPGRSTGHPTGQPQLSAQGKTGVGGGYLQLG